MTEKTQKDLLEELENSTITEILELHTYYHNAREERKYIEEYLIRILDYRPLQKYLKSLKNIPEDYIEDLRSKIEHARTVARDIVEHMEFENINSLKDIEKIIALEMKKRM